MLAEERRLFYVGMTRAKDQLILSRAAQRHWRGRVRELALALPRDIENELTKHQRMEPVRRKPQDRQLKLFQSASQFIRFGRNSQICGNAINSAMITTSQARNQ